MVLDDLPRVLFEGVNDDEGAEFCFGWVKAYNALHFQLWHHHGRTLQPKELAAHPDARLLLNMRFCAKGSSYGVRAVEGDTFVKLGPVAVVASSAMGQGEVRRPYEEGTAMDELSEVDRRIYHSTIGGYNGDGSPIGAPDLQLSLMFELNNARNKAGAVATVAENAASARVRELIDKLTRLVDGAAEQATKLRARASLPLLPQDGAIPLGGRISDM